MAKIANDVTELIGNTPLVKINKLFPDSQATVLAKLEFYNPASSVKDRIATSIVDAAEASGQLNPGGTIVEATSGNTGVGLALVGAARGYKVIITMPETMSKERRAIIRLLGAELVLTPGADGVPGANSKAAEIVENTPGAILASQFDNPANPAIHHDCTGEEIWNDTEGEVDAIVAGIGTGGTISGAGKYYAHQQFQSPDSQSKGLITMAKIANDITELIGNTPLVKINKLFPDSQATVLAKLEFYNPASSVKDRIAKSIIDAAEASGQLNPGGTIVEATSGNTGVGLALVGAARGYKVIITMPETMSKERRAIIRLLGAELVLTPGADGVPGANSKAAEIVENTPGAILASQFDNPANPAIHHDCTGEEIWNDTEGEVDAIVAGIGTGGTISGAGKYLKEKDPEIKIFGAEPAESPVITKGDKAPHKIQGWGPGFVPDNLDKSVVDGILLVPGDEAIAFARRAAAEEGIITGISGGGALQAAGQVVARPEFAGKTIVVVIADTGERYLSTALFEGLLD